MPQHLSLAQTPIKFRCLCILPANSVLLLLLRLRLLPGRACRQDGLKAIIETDANIANHVNTFQRSAATPACRPRDAPAARPKTGRAMEFK